MSYGIVTSGLQMVPPAMPPTATTVQQDWVNRSTAAGVIWATDFSNPADVNNWRVLNNGVWDPTPAAGSVGTFIRRGGTGVKGLPCLEMEQLANGNMNSYWSRPLENITANWPGSGATPLATYTTGQTLYLQLRNKWNYTRLHDLHNNSIKIANFSTIQTTNVNQEIFIAEQNDYGFPQIQGSTNTQNPTWRWDYTDLGGGQFDLQPGSAFGQCYYTTHPAGCWIINADEWMVHYLVVAIGSPNNKDMHIQHFVARPGQTSYTKIFDKFVGFPSPPGWEVNNGYTAMGLFAYENSRTTGAAGSKQYFDELILSAQPIACPQIYLPNTPAWLTGVTEKTWTTVAPANGASGSSSGIRPVDPDNDASANPNFPNPGPWDGNNNGGTFQGPVTEAWNGAAVLQTTRELAMAVAGGHSDRAGNEVYTLRLDAATPAWFRIKNPFSGAKNGISSNNVTAANIDGSPMSTHCYTRIRGAEGKIVIPGMDAVQGSAGYGTSETWAFDRTALSWTNYGLALPNSTSLFNANQWIIGPSCYDPTTGLVWSCGQETGGTLPNLFSFNARTGAITTYTTGSPGLGYSQGVCIYDVSPKMFVCTGSFGVIRWLNLDNIAAGWATITTTGTPTHYASSAMGGMAYHSKSRAILFWFDNDAANLVKLVMPSNPQTGTWTWSTVSPAAGNSVTPVNSAIGNGVWTRANIVEDIGGIDVFVNFSRHDGPTYVYRLPAAGV